MGNPAKNLSLRQCYSTAMSSFAKWWIPICLLAGTLMVVQLVPKQLVKDEMSALEKNVWLTVDAVKQGDMVQLENLSIELNETLWVYAEKMLMFSLFAAPFMALLGVFLICTSLMAVKNQRKNYSLGRVVSTSLVHMVIAFFKVLLIFLMLPLGMFIYVRLSFVSLIMLEEGHSPGEAIKESWEITRGNFWPLFGMVMINGTFQFAMLPTVVGLIPATGFANTARSAAYTMLSRNETISE